MSTGSFEDAPAPSILRSEVNTFEGRLPDPTEILRYGGRPGMEYLMLDARNLHVATQLDFPTGPWKLCREVPIYNVVGPKGATTLMVLGKGEPIEGSDPLNGVRRWSYDTTLLTTTGLENAYGKEEVPVRSQGDQGDARVEARPAQK